MASPIRYDKRINITLPGELLRHTDENAQRYDISRSAIIRWALHEWIDRHGRELPQTKKAVNMDQSFRAFIKPDMSPDELLNALQDYEAASSNQV
ncbi:MAG TPA: ribbon-helix-helix domain-containing protein [Candidatus Saccharimonadales bacterium]